MGSLIGKIGDPNAPASDPSTGIPQMMAAQDPALAGPQGVGPNLTASGNVSPPSPQSVMDAAGISTDIAKGNGPNLVPPTGLGVEYPGAPGSRMLKPTPGATAPDFATQGPTSYAAEATRVDPRTGVPVSPLANPRLTKFGKLATILLEAGQGALAGRAAQEQNLVASGGRRAGGIGVGMEAGYQLPFIRALQQQQAQKGQAEAQMATMQTQPVNLPGVGPMPWFLASKMIGMQKDLAAIGKDRFQTLRDGRVFDNRTQAYVPGTGTTDRPETNDQAVMSYLTSTKDPQLGRPMTPTEAYQTIKQMGQDAKPDKTPNDFEQYYTKFLRDNNLPDSAANMQRAHQQFEVKPVQPGAGDARLDRSYQFNSSQLQKLGEPIDALVTRMGRLQDTLNQNTPQADALVAPELLTVMAGGQGSGLRMNEAEIARIVGGRSNWQSLQAAANKWSTDPSTANSITPAQRQQIRSLVSTVGQKLAAKQAALDQAHQDMINATDVSDHRRIVAGARARMTAIDQGGQSSQISVTDPQGGVHTFADQASADKFKKLAGIQ